MRTRTCRGDGGAVLLLVLVIMSVLGLGAVSLGSLAFTTFRSARVFADHERLVNALDAGLAAAVVRLPTCDTTTIPDADGLAAKGLPGIDVVVTCAGPASPYVLTATAYTVQECSPHAPASAAPALQAVVRDVPNGTTIARPIEARRLDTSAPACAALPPAPTPSPSPSPSPTPSPTPDPTPSPSPSPDPTPSPTPEPSPSPTPDPTPSPTPDPTPSPTPDPTPSPTPDPTPEPPP